MEEVITKTTTKLCFRLSNPGYTIYHRAALGGLAATIRAWGTNPPDGIASTVSSNIVTLDWSEELSDQEALKRILSASFRLTPDKLIDLPGQGIGQGREDLRLAIHNAITQTFLQFHKFRPGEKEPRKQVIKSVDDEKGYIITYKALNSYNHQTAQGTGLLDEKHKGKFPSLATIPQWIVPGAFAGASPLEAPADEVILLMFLIVGCAVYHLRPRAIEEKFKNCLIVPDVTDLVAFGRALQRVATSGSSVRMFSNTYLGRIVGGAEEAALRFLIDISAADEIASERSISGCQAIAMGKVAWDGNQVNRSLSIRLRDNYKEIDVFRAANQFLGHSRALKTTKGESYVIPTSAIPELVAANLAAERHWCSHFKDLVVDREEKKKLLYAKGGLSAMRQAINDVDDKAVIAVFQDAWRRMMGSIFERSTRDGLIADRLLEVEREKIRNSILRAKTSDALAGWFLRFISEATHGGSLIALREDAARIREFIFNARNFERFQNLCLFALVSYESKSTAATGDK